MRPSTLLLVSAFCLGFVTVGDAQSFPQPTAGPVYDSKTMLPTSPEAALLGRFGDIPIGYYTGTADVSIPLYTIKESGLDIPIVLRYHGSGVRVWDQAGNVGLGWSLEPEGSIIQVVNGTEDHLDQIVSGDPGGYNFLVSRRLLGDYSVTNDIGTADWPCGPAGPTPEDSQETLFRLTQGDGQPDIYSYNFGGYSGKFYIDFETGQPVEMDKKDSIVFSNASNPYAWTATTMNGDVFSFNVMESSSTHVVTNHTGYTYKLTSVALHTGKTINFQYANGYYTWFTYTERYHTGYPDGLNPAAELQVQPLMDFPAYNTQNLTKINSSEVQVNFNLEDRTDLPGEADIDTIANNGVLSTKRIKSVDILSTVTGQKIESWRFFYSYFPYSTVGGSFVDTTGNSFILGSRLRLDSLQETGYLANGDSLSIPCYKFSYNSTPLPMKTSFAQDFWGYYNGKNNSGLIPNLAFFYFNRDPNYLNVPFGLMDSMFVTDRSPDSSMMTAGMLQQITYPTGGNTQFDYTPNSFSNYYYPDSAKNAATFRQNMVQDWNRGLPFDTLARSITVSRATLVEFDAQINAGNQQEGLTFAQMEQAFITLQKDSSGTLTTIQTWQMQPGDTAAFRLQGGLEWKQPILLNNSPNPNVSYLITATLPNSFGPQNTSTANAFARCTYTYYDTTANPFQRSLGGGVRVSGIRNYTDSGTLASHKVIRYVNTDSSSSGILMSPLVYYYANQMTFFNAIPNDGQQDWDPEESTDSIWFISAESSVPFSSAAGGNIVGYSRVEEWDVAPDGTNNGVHVYEYNNNADATAINCPDNPHLINGLISRETILTSALDTVSQSLYNYLGQGFSNFNGIKIFSLYDGVTACTLQNISLSIANGVDPYYFPLDDKYMIMFYPVNSAWYLQAQKINRYYSGSTILTDTVTSGYNSLGQLATTTFYNSKGQQMLTRTSYPIDSASSSNPTIQAMLRHSFYNYPLVTIASVNDTEVQRKVNAYLLNQNGLVILEQDSIQRSYNGGPLFTDVSFDGYGPYDNITHFIQRGKPTGLLWNLNSNKVIAEVKNAGFGSFAYTSFEPDESPSLTLSDTTRNRTASITGGQSYTFTSSSQITASLTFNQYVVSYWSRNGALTVSPSAGTAPGTAGPTRNGWTYYEHPVTASCSNFTITGPGVTVDELRIFPVNSLMTTYTYNPLIGITSQCDPAGHITYYDYDALGRLKDGKDENGNVIKTYEYHYKGQ